MLDEIPEFDLYYGAFLKGDPAKEPIAASYSAPGVLAEAATRSGERRVILNFGRSARRSARG
jgi:hypothetical protein